MNESEIRSLIFRLLGEIAPEADLSSVRNDRPLRDQLDIDSMDFLNLLIALSKELKVEVPEADYPKLSTLDGMTAYLNQVDTPE